MDAPLDGLFEATYSGIYQPRVGSAARRHPVIYILRCRAAEHRPDRRRCRSRRTIAGPVRTTSSPVLRVYLSLATRTTLADVSAV